MISPSLWPPPISAVRLSTRLRVGLAALAVVLAAAPGAAQGEELHSQLGGVSDNTSSQDFSSERDSLDTEAADDFTVPSGEGWALARVKVAGGYPTLPGPVESFTVRIYSNGTDGLPGQLVAERLRSDYAVDPDQRLFDIALSSPVELGPGTYWVSVQASLSELLGQWYWTNNATRSGAPAAYRNPGNGFGSGCTTWVSRVSCLGGDPDQQFALFGTRTHTLSVAATRRGNVRATAAGIDCGRTCSADLPAGTVVRLRARPDADARFGGWKGCDSSKGRTCVVAMSSDRGVEVRFRGRRGAQRS